MSQKQIGKIYGCSCTSIGATMKRYNIPTRKAGDNMKPNSENWNYL